MEKRTLAELAKDRGESTFRGHPVVWRESPSGGGWFYKDNMQPIPSGGGEARPCAKCGSEKWSGDGFADECLGLLPGVTNACCGHGDPRESYVCFENAVVLTGFVVDTPFSHPGD